MRFRPALLGNLPLLACPLLLASMALCPSTASAQVPTGQTANGETYVPAPGTGHDAIHLLSEHVNLASGTVSLAVQQPSRAAGRRFADPPIYNSLGTPPFHVGLSVGNAVSLEPTIVPSSGPYVTWTEASFIPPQNPSPNAPQQVQCSFATGFTFTDRFGVSHNLGLGVVAKDVNYTQNGNGPCLMGQAAFPPSGYGVGSGDGQVWAAWSDSSASEAEVGSWPYAAGQVPYGAVGGFTVTDKDGTTYSFGGDCQNIGPWNSTLCADFPAMEDRNGNYPTSGIGDLTYPTVPTAPTTSVNYSLPYQESISNGSGESIIGPGPGPGFNANLSATVPAWVEIPMPNGPNGQSVPPFMFYYGNYNPNDSSILNPYGLINEVVYPGGGWVKYTWTMSSDYRELSAFSGVGQETKYMYSGAYVYRYKMPVLAERQVSYDGVHVAETQTFTYTTTWPSNWQPGNSWTLKTTSVVTTDNIRNQSYLTVYTYAPTYPSGGSGSLSWGSVSPEIPVEQTIQYYAGSTTSSQLLRTVTKSWLDEFDLAEEDTTLDNGLTSKVVYSYTGAQGNSCVLTTCDPAVMFPVRLQEKDEYDYGATTPTRVTKYQYQIFGIGPGSVPVPPKPSSVQVFNSAGTEVSETDYGYDQTSLSDPGSIYMHDDSGYGASVTNRGDPTTIRRKCFAGSTSSTCTDSVTTYTYDKAGQVMSKTDACGNATCSDMSGSNHTTTYSRADNYTCLQSNAQNGACSGLPGNTDDYVTSVTDPLGHTAHYSYDYYSGELTSSTDVNGLVTRYMYSDAMRRPTETDYPDGGQTSITYNDAAPNPSATTSKKLNSSQPPVTSTAYQDGIGHVTETILNSDPSGPDYTITTYDGLGRTWQAYNPTRCAPSAIGQPPSSCGESTWGNPKTYTYDALGRTTQVTDQDGQQVTTAYSGNETTVTDEAGHTRSSFTDALGRLTEVDEPVVSGDAASGTGSVTISGGPAATYTFNPCANNTYPAPTYCPATVYNNATFQVTINNQTFTSGCGGTATSAQCATSLASTINGSSYVTAAANGSTVNITAIATGPASNYSLSVTYNWNTTYFSSPSYTAAASGSSLTGGVGPITTYTYDALNDLLSVTQVGGSTNQANWRVRTFGYDSLGRLLCSSNPENSSAACPASATLSYTAGTVGYAYDANGNAATKTGPKQNQTATATVTTTYSYDALDRVTEKSYSNGDPSISYAYDQSACIGTSPCFNIGHRTTMNDAAGNESWSYAVLSSGGAPNGTQTTEQRTTNGIQKTTTYTYDLAGDLESVIYPFGRQINYAVDNAGRLASAADSGTTYASGALYSPAGSLCSLAYGGSAIFETATYNSRFQPAEMQASTSAPGTPCVAAGTGTLLDLTYNFVDANGHNNGDVIGIANNRDWTRSQVFAYDALNRLVTAGTANTTSANCWGEAYTYDPWANLTSLSPATGYSTSCKYENAFTYTISAQNRVTNPAFGYDAAGNAMAAGQAYNAESELTAAGGTTGMTYVYDGDGNRIEKVVNGSVGKIYWYGSGTVILDETDGSGSTSNASFNEYIFFGAARIARRDASGDVFYYVEDHLGTSRVIVQAGATSACYDADFYPFGGEIAYLNSCPQNYKFEGHERDAETGYDNFGARFYNSSSAPAAGVPFGRFTSADWSAVPAPVPYANLTNPQTLNLYAIVSDNPETFADLDGHQPGCADLMAWFMRWITFAACNGSEDPNQGSEYWNTLVNLAVAASAAQDPSGTAPPANCPDCSGAPAQQKKTDTVTVEEVKGQGGNVFNHAAISVDGKQPVGLEQKKDSASAALFDKTTPGAVRPVDPKREVLDKATIPITHDQAKHIQTFLDNAAKSPPNYNLYHSNCAEFCEAGLKAGGVKNVPNDTTPGGLVRDLHGSGGGSNDLMPFGLPIL